MRVLVEEGLILSAIEELGKSKSTTDEEDDYVLGLMDRLLEEISESREEVTRSSSTEQGGL